MNHNHANDENQMTVLLTGARAPVTLDLARSFSHQKIKVITAESLPYPLSRRSNSISKNYQVTAPNQNHQKYIEDLISIILREKVSLLIPTCEEAFHIAMAKTQLERHTRVLVSDSDLLQMLHSKFNFNALAKNLNFKMPETHRVTNTDDANKAIQKLTIKQNKVVLKPEYSRFAAKTLILTEEKALQQLPTLSLSNGVPWVIQECLEGPEYCTYSYADQGQLLAHVTYDHAFTAGRGAGICFKAIRHAAIENWVLDFVKKTNFTGQISFDFIETSPGIVMPLECNPRATSGLHLIANRPDFIQALIRPEMTKETSGLKMIRPIEGQEAQIRLAMLVYGLAGIRSLKSALDWFRIFVRSREVIFSFNDPLPFFDQFYTFYKLTGLAKSKGVSPLEASTLDIEWNG